MLSATSHRVRIFHQDSDHFQCLISTGFGVPKGAVTREKKLLAYFQNRKTLISKNSRTVPKNPKRDQILPS